MSSAKKGVEKILDEWEVDLLREFNKARRQARRQINRKGSRMMVVKFKVDGRVEELHVQHMIPQDGYSFSDFK